MKRIFSLVVLLTLSAAAAGSKADQGRFFTKFTGGVCVPYLSGLDEELELQGRSGVDPGIAFAVSIGRTLLDDNIAVELSFNLSRHPTFYYNNGLEGDLADEFYGKLTHYGFHLAAKKCFRPGSTRFVPYAGMGLGYGNTSLISGGGKIDGFESIAFIQLEHEVRENIRIIAEGMYCWAWTDKKYSSPFLEESDYDNIIDSNELPLEDRYSSIEFRVGVTILLKPLKR